MVILAGLGLWGLLFGFPSLLQLLLYPFKLWGMLILYAIAVVFVLPWLLLMLCIFSI